MADPVRSDAPDEVAARPTDESNTIVVKKYANRRLYNTAASSYVTLDHLAQLVKEGKEFVVYDAKSGEDITRQVLTQIIVEQEGKGGNLLPIGFLRQLISFYDNSLQSIVPRYLEYSIGIFARQQEQMRRTMQQTMEGLFPFSVEEMSKQNVAMMERAFSLFAPFYRPAASHPPGGEQGRGGDEAAELESLRREVARLREELATLKKTVGP